MERHPYDLVARAIEELALAKSFARPRGFSDALIPAEGNGCQNIKKRSEDLNQLK